jgi:hypothetical protein
MLSFIYGLVVGVLLGGITGLVLAIWAMKINFEKQKELEKIYVNTILGIEKIHEGHESVERQREEMERMLAHALDNLPPEIKD